MGAASLPGALSWMVGACTQAWLRSLLAAAPATALPACPPCWVGHSPATCPLPQVFAPLARLLGLYAIKEELEELSFK